MRKTRDYFLYEVDSLPAQISDSLPGDIQKIIVIPPQESLTPQRSLVFSPDQIIVLEWFQNIDFTSIPVKRLIQIDLTSILLYGLVRFIWADETQIHSKDIEFNTVGYGLISKQVNWLRTQMIQSHCPAQAKTVPLPELPPQFPLKFRNYLHLGLLSGECIFTAVYQPRFERTPARVLALTDDFLVVVEESGKHSYGMTLSYCPHRFIQQIESETTQEIIWLWFTVGLHRQTKKLGFPLSQHNAAALERGFHKVAA
ncbi:MAG: hypothetical protein K8I82_09605 [Anaerolineae bacterium]|nr:hypothetical protein [Anaerolineae bacterium]